MTKRLAIWLAVVILAGACRAGGAEATHTTIPATTPTTGAPPTTSTEPATEDVAVRLLDPDTRPESEAGVLGTFTLVGCRWLSPGVYAFDLTWEAPTETAFPASFVAALGFIQGDTGTGALVEATVPAAEAFTAVLDWNEYSALRRSNGDDAGHWQAGRHTDILTASGPCDASVWQGHWVHAGWVEPEFDPVAPPGPSGPTDDLDDLVAQIDPLDVSEPLLPLVFLFAAPDLPEFDRLFIDPESLLQWVDIEQLGSCLTVTSTYGDPDQTLSANVVQRIGCPATESFETAEVAVADPVWDVRVAGSSWLVVESVAARLESIARGSVEPAQPTGFDADSVIDARLAELPDSVEVARFDWSDGRIAVVASPTGRPGRDSYADPIVAVPNPFNGGGAGMDCRDFSVVAYDDGERGFLIGIVQSGELAMAFGYRGGLRSVPMEPAAGGRMAGLIDLDPESLPLDFDSIAVTDADGNPVPCIQD